MVQYAAAQFSSDLFRNRLSDLCGWVQKVWNWFGVLLLVGVFIGVIWYTIAEDPANAINAWWIVAIAFCFWIMSIVFGFLCKLLTGRAPGQAMQARKWMAEYVRTQHAKSEREDEDYDEDYDDYEIVEPEEEKPGR